MAHSHRPSFLNLMQIQMPVGALTSIGHRISGVLLAMCVPIGVYMLDLSLQSEQTFLDVTSLFRYWPVKAAAIFTLWIFTHHVLAGVRHLLSDFNVGSTLHMARRSAWFVNLGGLAAALFAAGVWL